jgi:hypothetical protein
VRKFLKNVHAEREKPHDKKINDIGDDLGKYSQYYQNGGLEDLVYYDGMEQPITGASILNNRMRRNFEKGTSLEFIFELPIGNASENWYLVTNDDLGKALIHDESMSRIHDNVT